VVPGGCTKFVQVIFKLFNIKTSKTIQPPDLSWNAPLKARIRELHNIWMLNGDRMEFTSGGNSRPPSIDVYLEWIVDAWKGISKEAIEKSFKNCGISISTDGSEDNLIHCFKEHGAIPEGRLMLQETRKNFQNNMGVLNLEEEIDESEDEDKKYDSDESIEIEM
jgi:hypothetical protein